MEILDSGAQRLGLNLTSGQLEQFEIYYRELADWNRKVNLTAIIGYGDVQAKHFLDSLTLVPALGEIGDGSGRSLIDIGTGAGLPGLPLKILMPALGLTLLEATAKKAKFLEHVAAVLGLGDVAIVVGRAEAIAHDAPYREKFDIVLARAVAEMAALAELTLPFAAVGGVFIAQKKGDIGAEMEGAQPAIAVLGGKLREVKAITLPELDDGRCLVIVDKVSPTPVKYPRRPGIPAKRPLA
jgi:16S rRNA (guanine527-N7)-methyltransferase